MDYLKNCTSVLKNMIDYTITAAENVVVYSKEAIVISIINNLLKEYLKYELEIGQTKTDSKNITFLGTEKIKWIEFDEYTFNEYLKDSPFLLLSFKLQKLRAPLKEIMSKNIQFSAENVVIVLTTNKEANKNDFGHKEKKKKSRENNRNRDSDDNSLDFKKSYNFDDPENNKFKIEEDNIKTEIDPTDKKAFQETYKTLKELIFTMIENLHIEISNLKIILHHEDKVFEFSIDNLNLQKESTKISDNQFNKEILFRNIQVSLLHNSDFSNIISRPNKTKDDKRFERLMKSVETNTDRKKLFSYINDKQKKQDSINIEYHLEKKIGLKANFLSGDIVYDLNLESIELIKKIASFFSIPVESNEFMNNFNESIHNTPNKNNNENINGNRIVDENNPSPFSKMIDINNFGPSEFSKFINVDSLNLHNKEDVNFSFELKIKKVKISAEIDKTENQTTLALLDCFGINFFYSTDVKRDTYISFSLEKLALTRCVKKLIGNIPTFETMNVAQLSQAPQKEVKDIFHIKMSPMSNVSTIDIKFNFEYNIELDFHLPFIKQIMNLFEMKDNTTLRSPRQLETPKNNNKVVLKFSSKKINLNIGFASVNNFGNLNFSIKNLVFVLDPDPLRLFLNIDSFLICDKQFFKIQVEPRLVNNQKPKIFYLSIYSPNLLRNSSIPDPNDLNSMFSKQNSEEDIQKNVNEKHLTYDIDYNGVAYMFGNDIDSFKLKKSNKIGDYKEDADYFVDISSPPLNVNITKNQLLKIFELSKLFSGEKEENKTPSGNVNKVLIAFSSPEIEANLMDDIHNIPFVIKSTNLNVFTCLKEMKKDINFSLINYDSLNLTIQNSKMKSMVFPLLSRINEKDQMSNSLLHGSPVVLNVGKWTSTHNNVTKQIKTGNVIRESKIDTHVIVKNISVVPSLFHWFKFLGFADPIDEEEKEKQKVEGNTVNASQWNLFFDRISIICQDINMKNRNTVERPHSIITLDSLYLANIQFSSLSYEIPIIFKNISVFIANKSSYPPLLYDSFLSLIKEKKYAKVVDISDLKILLINTAQSFKTFINFDPMFEEKNQQNCTIKVSTKSDTFKTMVDLFPGFFSKLMFLLTFDPLAQYINENKNNLKSRQIPPQIKNDPKKNKEEKKEKKILSPQKFSITMNPKKKSYSVGETVKINWNAIDYNENLSTSSYIALAKASYADNKSYGDMKDRIFFKTNGKKSGEYNFTIPNKIGKMEMRIYDYFYSSSYSGEYKLLSRSETFRVGLKMKLHVERERNKVYVQPIILYAENQSGQWTPKNTDNIVLYNSNDTKITSKPFDKDIVTFEINEPGKYFFRYESGYMTVWKICKSKMFEVNRSNNNFSNVSAQPTLDVKILGLRLGWCMIEGTQFYKEENNEELKNNESINKKEEKQLKSYLTTYVDIPVFNFQRFDGESNKDIQEKDQMRMDVLLKDIRIKDKVKFSNRNEMFCTNHIKNQPSNYFSTFSLVQHHDETYTMKLFLDKIMCLNLDQITLHFLVNFFYPFLIEDLNNNNDVNINPNLNNNVNSPNVNNNVNNSKNNNNNNNQNNINQNKNIKINVNNKSNPSKMHFRYFCISDIFCDINFRGRGSKTIFKFIDNRIQQLFLNMVGCFSLNGSVLELHSRLVLDCDSDRLMDKLIHSWFPTHSSKIRFMFSILQGNLALKRIINFQLAQGIADFFLGCSNLISYVDDTISGKKTYKSSLSERANVPNGLKEGLLESVGTFKDSLVQVFHGLFTETSSKYQNEGLYSAARQFLSGAVGVFTKPSKSILKTGANILNGISSDKEIIERAKKIYKHDYDDEKEDLISFEKLDGLEDTDENFKNESEKK